MRAWVLSAVILLAACSSGSSPSETTTGRTTPTDQTTMSSLAETTTSQVSEQGVTWTPCGAVRCGVISVPVDPVKPDGRRMSVAVYARDAVAVAPKDARTVVLLPDFDGPSARELVEQATVMIGPAARSLNIVSMSPRGFFDSTPLPCEPKWAYIGDEDDPVPISQSCVSNPDLSPQNMGTIAAAYDLQVLVEQINAGPVRLVGWGHGATIGAAWAMSHPSSLAGAVLDSPIDPGISQVKVAAMNRSAEDFALARVLSWCTEHLSCPLIENATKRVDFVLDDIRTGKPGVAQAKATEGTFRLAFRAVMASGDYGALFQAMAEAEKGNFVPLVDLSGETTADQAGTLPARVAVACSDVRETDLDRIIADDVSFESKVEPYPTIFRVGLGTTLPRICRGMPTAAQPLGAMTPADGSTGANVRVFAASGDGLTSTDMSRAFSKRMGWKFRAVRANRHLVVGWDRTTTRVVSDFLLS